MDEGLKEQKMRERLQQLEGRMTGTPLSAQQAQKASLQPSPANPSTTAGTSPQTH